MTQPEETPVSFIPSNFIEKGKILNGTFDIRNAIESIVLSLAIGIPVFHLPLSLTARIIILCMTALPAAMVALIGIGGESITAFLMNALRFVVNRRVIWRSDSLPEGTEALPDSVSGASGLSEVSGYPPSCRCSMSCEVRDGRESSVCFS